MLPLQVVVCDGVVLAGASVEVFCNLRGACGGAMVTGERHQGAEAGVPALPAD